jgi:hypothetical protein
MIDLMKELKMKLLSGLLDRTPKLPFLKRVDLFLGRLVYRLLHPFED